MPSQTLFMCQKKNSSTLFRGGADSLFTGPGKDNLDLIFCRFKIFLVGFKAKYSISRFAICWL